MMYVIPITIRNTVFKLTQFVSTWAMKMVATKTNQKLHGINSIEQRQLQLGQRLEINFDNKTIARHNFTGKQLRCILNNVERRVCEQIGQGGVLESQLYFVHSCLHFTDHNFT